LALLFGEENWPKDTDAAMMSYSKWTGDGVLHLTGYLDLEIDHNEVDGTLTNTLAQRILNCDEGW
jgi:hypothetical protein